MIYDEELIKAFAARTGKNLEYIEQQQKAGAEVFEVTQLVNSLLGLLVFPQQQYFTSIPRIPLAELENFGWPSITITQGESECQTFVDVVRFLRNGIAHSNISFLPDGNGQIRSMRIWNQFRGQRNWEAEITVSQLRKITEVFLDIIEDTPGRTNGSKRNESFE